MNGLEKLREQFPQMISNVRGRGLMCAFDLPSGDIRDKAIGAMAASDLLVLSSGHQSIRFRPALNLSIDEASEGLRRMEKAIKTLA
jgi:L-lysine 6-transaminase